MSSAGTRPGRTAGAIATASAALALLALSGCGGSAPGGSRTTLPPSTTVPEVTTAPPTTEPAAAGRSLRLYFVKGEKLAVSGMVAPSGPAVATAALTGLLGGPTGAAAQAGMTSAIPAGTRLLGITVASGTATVNLTGSFQSGGGSLSMQLRAAQVVFTLTQFPTVQRVDFELDGERVSSIGGEGVMVDGVGRAAFEDVTPAILVESPLPGDSVHSPLQTGGTANTFEATVNYTLTGPGGEVLAEGHTMATSGTGTRGSFSVAIPYRLTTPGPGRLSVYELSAKDGSRQSITDVPLQLG